MNKIGKGKIRDFASYAKKSEETPARETPADDKSGTRRIALNEPSYIEKIRSHRLAIFYRTALGIALVAALLAVCYISWRDKIFTEAVEISTAPVSDVRDAQFISFGENFLKYSKDGISCMNSSGDALWNQTYEMQSPMVHTSGEVVAVGDYNGHMIYIAGKNGPAGTVDTNLPIRNFAVASQGVVAAVLDDKDVTWIYLYDSEGNPLASFKTTMADSGYPVAVALSPNGQLVAVSFLYASEGRLKSSVAFYNFGSVGQNAIDNYVSGYDYTGVVVPYISFLNENTVCAVADDRIMFFEGAQIPTSLAEHLTSGDEIIGVYCANEHAGLLFHNNTSEGAYRLQIYDKSGARASVIYFDQQFEDIMLLKDRVIVYGSDAWIVYDMNGDQKFAGAFDEPVRVLAPTDLRNRFTAVTSNAVKTYELR